MQSIDLLYSPHILMHAIYRFIVFPSYSNAICRFIVSPSYHNAICRFIVSPSYPNAIYRFIVSPTYPNAIYIFIVFPLYPNLTPTPPPPNSIKELEEADSSKDKELTGSDSCTRQITSCWHVLTEPVATLFSRLSHLDALGRTRPSPTK